MISKRAVAYTGHMVAVMFTAVALEVTMRSVGVVAASHLALKRPFYWASSCGRAYPLASESRIAEAHSVAGITGGPILAVAHLAAVESVESRRAC